MNSALQKNINTIYWMSFFQCAMIVTAVFVPLLQRHGLTMSQILQTQALFAFVIAGFEVPSGYLADLWGRKNTIIGGQFIIAVAFILLVSADSFFDFLFYEALMGLGMSLCSGADLALIYDSQIALNSIDESHAENPGKHISRLVSLEGWAGAISAILASVLTLWSLDWILWAQALIACLAFYCSLHLVEAPRETSVLGHKENFRKVAASMISNRLILWVSLGIIVFGLAALFGFWLMQTYWEAQGVPIAWFGFIWALHCVVRAITAHYAHRLEELLGWRRIFVFTAALPFIAYLIMALVGGPIGILFGLAFPLCRGLNMVIFYDALNKRLDAEFRATVNSLVSLGMRSIFIVMGPILGFLVDSYGVNISLLVLAGWFLPTVIFVLFGLSKQIKAKEENENEKNKSDEIESLLYEQ
ncbi:MAG: MFS transporter [SAR86 cluster bacterium]|uniref:MFS transporter n=1 Tax=SAR86 cluster bacterium TaxID=2030880 RepID=A0A2A5CGL6_9GAMM|nr:MAG: MFS transporter [SAR86 cluster bacterium]